MLIALVSVMVGLGLVVVSGDVLVRGSAALAENLGVPPLIVGLTIVAFGTSAPELFVGVDAVLRDAAPLALGNVVGSNIANALLVVGLPALIAPMTCTAPRLNRNMAVMLAVTAVFIAVAFTGEFDFPEGLFLLALLAIFLTYSGLRASVDPEAAQEILGFEEEIQQTRSRPWLAAVFVFGGLAGLLVGADLLVTGSVDIARALGVSEAIIGLTLVALGTSLPELATAIAAAVRCQCDVALGNVIGSNIFNLLGIMGVASLFGDIPVPKQFLQVDLWVMLAASLALLPFTLRNRAVRGVAGLLLLLGYTAYMGWLVYSGGVATPLAEAL